MDNIKIGIRGKILKKLRAPRMKDINKRAQGNLKSNY